MQPAQDPSLFSEINRAIAGQNTSYQVESRLAYQKDYFGGRPVANLKSQIKRNRQNEKRRLRNRVYRGSTRVAIKNARIALEADKVNVEEARTATMLAVSRLDIAAQKGVIHKKNASRRKGRLMKHLAKLEKEA